ncbi:histidine phosphatase family protein [Candidatus Uhrbacteria bacterium]|nr:histidine phosphatase family protein [Candidatus Uhrbacteria bacterium]
MRTRDNEELRFSSGDRDVPILQGQEFSSDAVEGVRVRVEGGLIVAHTGLKRTEQTAEMLTPVLCFEEEPLILPQFRERLGGTLAGLRFSELQRIFPDLKSPAGLWTIEALEMGLESVETFLGRIEDGLNRLTQLVSEVDATLLVAHAGSIKGIKAVLTEEKECKRRRVLCEPTPEHKIFFHFQIERR